MKEGRHLIEEFGKADIENYTGLDIIACQIAAAGACGYHGGVLLVTSDKRILFTCYLEPSAYSGYFKYTPEEDIPKVFPEFEILRKDHERWKDTYLGLGNILYVRNDYFEAFSKAAEDLLAADHEMVLYSCWKDAILEAIEPGQNVELIRNIKAKADERDAIRDRITELQEETESQEVTVITQENIFKINPENILIWRCWNNVEGMDKEGHLFQFHYSNYRMLTKPISLLFYRGKFWKTFFPILRNWKSIQRLIQPVKLWVVTSALTKVNYGPEWDDRHLPGHTLLIRSEYTRRFDGLIRLFFEKFCSHNCFGIIKHIRGAE